MAPRCTPHWIWKALASKPATSSRNFNERSLWGKWTAGFRILRAVIFLTLSSAGKNRCTAGIALILDISFGSIGRSRAMRELLKRGSCKNLSSSRPRSFRNRNIRLQNRTADSCGLCGLPRWSSRHRCMNYYSPCSRSTWRKWSWAPQTWSWSRLDFD